MFLYETYIFIFYIIYIYNYDDVRTKIRKEGKKYIYVGKKNMKENIYIWRKKYMKKKKIYTCRKKIYVEKI